MRIVLSDPETPAPTWWERLLRPTWRWMGPVCVVAMMAWLLIQTGVSEIAPDRKHPPLRLAHPKPSATDWPSWRGPTQQGTADESAAPPLQWSPSTKFAWQTLVPGGGRSSPCVWDKDIYLTAVLPETRAVVLLKFDRDTGRLAWQTELCRASETALDEEIVPTPACDGRLVYVPVVDDGQVWLCAVNVAGTLQWKRAAGPYCSTKAYRSSPVVHGSLVYVAVDHRGSRLERWRPVSTLSAFHRQTGEIVWRVPRPNGDSAGVPVVAEIAGRSQLVLAGRHAITSYDPETGVELWFCRWNADRVTGSIAYDDEHIYACARHPEAETLCIKADGEGDVTETHIVWRERRSATEGPSPVVVGPALLLLGDQGLLTALDKASGRLLWQRRLTGQFDASPVVVKNRLYCTNREGVTYVVDCDRRGEVLAESPLGQPITSSIAISGHRLIVRGNQHLLMITPPDRDIYAAEPAPSPRKF